MRLARIVAVATVVLTACVQGPVPTAASREAGGPPATPGISAGASSVALPKPEVTALRVGSAAHEADGYAPEFANYLGLYQNYGFERVETHFFDGDARGRQALLAGQVDVLEASAGSAISALGTDSPLVMVAMFVNHPTDDLVSVPTVKTVDDLKGKTVAVSTFGGDSHASVLLSLKTLGLQSSDVTILQVGGESARIAALLAGSVAAAAVDDSNEDTVKGQGLNVLVHLADAPATLARAGLLVRRDWAAQHPDTVLDVVAASLEAQQRMYTDTDVAIDGFARWAQTKDRAGAAKEVRGFLRVGQRDLRTAPDGWQNLREVMATVDPRLKDVDVTTAYTYEYLDKLKALGFDRSVGVPGA